MNKDQTITITMECLDTVETLVMTLPLKNDWEPDDIYVELIEIRQSALENFTARNNNIQPALKVTISSSLSDAAFDWHATKRYGLLGWLYRLRLNSPSDDIGGQQFPHLKYLEPIRATDVIIAAMTFYDAAVGAVRQGGKVGVMQPGVDDSYTFTRLHLGVDVFRQDKLLAEKEETSGK